MQRATYWTLLAFRIGAWILFRSGGWWLWLWLWLWLWVVVVNAVMLRRACVVGFS